MRKGEGKRIVWTGFVSSYGGRRLHLPFTVGLDNETYSHIIYLAEASHMCLCDISSI